MNERNKFIRAEKILHKSVCRVCKVRPRAIDSTGHVRSYCRECSTIQHREHARTEKGRIAQKRVNEKKGKVYKLRWQLKVCGLPLEQINKIIPL